MQISRIDSERITILRALALTSVVSAHTASVVLKDKGTVFCSDLLSAYGSIGVIVFFIISGYLFELQNKSGKEFWKSKFMMIIPWMVCGTMAYLYTALRRNDVSVIDWISSLIIHSHYYYLSVLFMLYAFYRIIKRMIKEGDEWMFHFILIILSMISIFLTEYGIIPIYPYINFMNWAAYFSIGCILVQKNKTFFHRNINLNAGVCGIAITLFLIVYNMIFQKPLGYWTPFSAVIIILMAYYMWSATLSLLKTERVKDVLIKIGKYSFSIYLVHMPFAGVITNLTNRLPYQGGLIFLRPILVVGITYFALRVFEYVAKRLHVENWYRLCVGIR